MWSFVTPLEPKFWKFVCIEPLNHNKEKQWLDPCLRMIEHWVYVGLKTSWGERGYLIKLRKVTSSWKWWLKKKKKNIESHLTHNWKSKKVLQKKRNEYKWCQNKRITKSKEWRKWKRMNSLCNEDTQVYALLSLRLFESKEKKWFLVA